MKLSELSLTELLLLEDYIGKQRKIANIVIQENITRHMRITEELDRRLATINIDT